MVDGWLTDGWRMVGGWLYGPEYSALRESTSLYRPPDDFELVPVDDRLALPFPSIFLPHDHGIHLNGLILGEAKGLQYSGKFSDREGHAAVAQISYHDLCIVRRARIGGDSGKG